MNKGIIRAIVLTVVFLAAVKVFGYVTNKTNQDMTTEMGEAVLPTVTMFYQEKEINRLYGYVDEMNAIYMRNDITPVDTDHILPICIHTNQYAVDEISYEIRSMDTERLIAKTVVEEYEYRNGLITADLTIQNLLDANREYLLILSLAHDDETVRFYTRIIEPSDCHVSESIEFARNFHDSSWSKEDYKNLAIYMEPDSSADNTTLAEVTIHSSLKQVAWADFDGKPVGSLVVSLKEINAFYNVVMLDYVVGATGADGESEYYNVEEYYRLRYSPERMYLLDYRRTMNELFRADSDNFRENYIDLGIGNQNIEYKYNGNGSHVCFVAEGDLWCYSAPEQKLTQVFSFRGYEGVDDRENHMEHSIRIVKVDETGSVDFVVYGYMNREHHEGQVGICVYHYDSVVNTIEEELFLPSTHSYEVLKWELGQLIYENEAGHFFILMNRTLYEIDLMTREITELVQGLNPESYTVSSDGQYIAYIEDGDGRIDKPLVVLNLENGSSFEIQPHAHYYVRPLNFMGDDLIYGEVEEDRVYTDQAGNRKYPMSDVYIIATESPEHEVLKDYYKDGYYTESIEVRDDTIYLNRVEYNGFNYSEASGDTIMNREGGLLTMVGLSGMVTERKETETHLVMNEYVEIESKRFLTPKQILLEGDSAIDLGEADPEEFYYVYARGKVIAAAPDAAAAIRVANANMGVVVGSRQQYIWKRAWRSARSDLEVTIGETDMDSSSIAKALNAMAQSQQISIAAEQRLEAGETPSQILSESLTDGQIVDLSGCDVEAVLYYISLGTPVFAMESGEHGVLLVGYDEKNLHIYDPLTGEVEMNTFLTARERFARAGNVYLAYLKEE